MSDFSSPSITKENLIDIVCKWMDYHNKDTDYITCTNGAPFINGGYQTDLRAFINNIITSGISYWEAIDMAKKY